MKILKRKHVSKGKSAAQFKRNVSHTKAANIQPPPMRGGWRM